jgi:DNA (cytosine-5)-methyltransferase 1
MKTVLDLFCGGGGSAYGYWQAGYSPVGIDIRKQPDYPFPHFIGDAMRFREIVSGVESVELIHASPPCQAFTIAGNLARAQGKQASTVDLLTPIRPLLKASGVPYVIENVKGAPLENPVMLCGSMFGLKVRRHRLFECSFPVEPPGPCRHKEQGKPVGVYHAMNDSIPQGGTTAKTLEEAQEAMGIDWLPWRTLKEAVPPAYTRWIAGFVR